MKKYDVIYADPPWRYADKRKGSGGAEDHYPTMSVEEICALQVSNIAAQDSLLFLWATFPCLKEAFLVMESWGFKYKTLGFAWIKTNPRQKLGQQSFLPTDTIDDVFGIGHYTKSNCEVCLIGTKGRAKSLIASNAVASTIVAPRTRHSAKPQLVRERIEKLVGGGRSMVELFSRQKSPLWDVWGNEVDSDIKL